MGRVLDAIIPLLAIGLSLGIGALLIATRCHSPWAIYGVLFSDTLGDPAGISQIIYKATTLSFTGLAAAWAFRAGLFNIGGEAQLYTGAFACAVAARWLPSTTAPLLAWILLPLAALLGGILAAFLPAWLKARRGLHEVITTMMMNFIWIAGVNWCLGFVRASREVVRTPDLPISWRWPLLVRGFDGNAAFGLAIAACGVVWAVYARSRLGYELRAIGLNPAAAEYGGIDVRNRMIVALLGSGALAGLGGVNFVLGSPGYFEQHFAPSQGYLGIAVALLGRNQPIAIVPAALLFAALDEGGQAIQGFVPKELGTILQGLIVVLVVVGRQLGGRILERRRVKVA